MIQICGLALGLHFVKSGWVLVQKETLQNLLLSCKVICVLTVCMFCVWGAKIQAPGRIIGVTVAAGRGEITSTGGAHRCSGAGAHQQREELGEDTTDVGADTGMQRTDDIGGFVCFSLTHSEMQHKDMPLVSSGTNFILYLVPTLT